MKGPGRMVILPVVVADAASGATLLIVTAAIPAPSNMIEAQWIAREVVLGSRKDLAAIDQGQEIRW